MRILTFLLLALLTVPPAAAEDAPALRVMTFNIRFGTAEDGENHWDHRKDFVVDTVADFDPDIVGYQEMMPFQETYVQDHLPGYGLSGSVQVARRQTPARRVRPDHLETRPLRQT